MIFENPPLRMDFPKIFENFSEVVLFDFDFTEWAGLVLSSMHIAHLLFSPEICMTVNLLRSVLILYCSVVRR